ncbi:hypothetical protein scyTo_0023870 [Scyliorhinus torazame]|uniref:Uncharacterized protein n=1 Tax=Scyliorhinus torazame TaxID=75743 RepID=A0A401QBP6_SCYTO|nr:hypothetical protein [Scyliorhinus torazame]
MAKWFRDFQLSLKTRPKLEGAGAARGGTDYEGANRNRRAAQGEVSARATGREAKGVAERGESEPGKPGKAANAGTQGKSAGTPGKPGGSTLLRGKTEPNKNLIRGKNPAGLIKNGLTIKRDIGRPPKGSGEIGNSVPGKNNKNSNADPGNGEEIQGKPVKSPSSRQVAGKSGQGFSGKLGLNPGKIAGRGPARPEPKPDPKAGKADPKGGKGGAPKAERADAKSGKADPKGGKADLKTGKSETQAGKTPDLKGGTADPKSGKTAGQGPGKTGLNLGKITGTSPGKNVPKSGKAGPCPGKTGLNLGKLSVRNSGKAGLNPGKLTGPGYISAKHRLIKVENQEKNGKNTANRIPNAAEDEESGKAKQDTVGGRLIPRHCETASRNSLTCYIGTVGRR